MSDPPAPRTVPRPRSPSGTFDPLPEWVGPSSTLLHGARRPELNAGAVVPPIYQTSTFHFPLEFSDAGPEGKLYLYTRDENPSLEVPAELVRRLEHAEGARVFGSGMGAMTTTLLTFLSAGDEVVALDVLYGGTLDLLRDVLPRMGIQVRWVTAAEAREPETALSSATRLVVLESPTNPLLGVIDLKRWAEAADRRDALVVVDNTFATPINQNPLDLGADLVTHSGTKYLGGHADLLAGAIAGAEPLLERIDRTHQVVGSVLDPFAAFLLTRGLRSLALRVERQNESGRRIAGRLAKHPQVERVLYPGYSSPGEETIAARQMRGRGGMLSVVLRGGHAAAQQLLRHLRLVHVASSLGGVESLVSVPRDTSHRHLTDLERRERGIVDGLVRFSLGIEETADLERDLVEALDALPASQTPAL